MASRVRTGVVWHLGGGEMGMETQWPQQNHQHQPSAQQTPSLISLAMPNNLTLQRQSVYPSLDDIWHSLLSALQKK